MNELEQRKAAKEFAEKWKGKGDEKQHTSQFWSDLLHRVYGITDFSDRVEFEKRVPLLHTSFIDVFIPETKVIIEQKSMDVDLLKRKKQSDGSELNPFEQAQRYGGKLPYSERPRWIVTCNFQKFLIYDMDEVRPEEKPIEILLEDLPEKYHLLSFLLDAAVKKITVEQQLSFKAGELVGKLYDLMLPQYKDPTSESTMQALNKFCVRIVFCLYAEDALLFGPKGNEFYSYLVSFLPENRRKALIALFRILDQPEESRDPYEDKKLLDFPYVNGGLFAGDIEIPQLTDEIMQLILKDMSENLDWSKISPTIFGAVFESTLNPETRRSGGMHYTSIKNIHKVIDPLFLNDLQDEYEKIITDKMSAFNRRVALEKFTDKLSSLNFLDPACGSGNFLTETFLSLRRLENEVIKKLDKKLETGQGALNLVVKVSIGQFAGIEINDFAVTVARTALWIAESQMIKETESIVNQTIEFFPLKTDAKIIEGNALLMDWNDAISKYTCSYIMGNPPFVGKKEQNKLQKETMVSVFDRKTKGVGNLDFVCGWYAKAIQYIQNTRIKVAFVSTNSITQGEQVSSLWNFMIRHNAIIHFCYRSFDWSNEAIDKAAVYVVIIGFCAYDDYVIEKKIYQDEQATIANNINPYLVDAPTMIIDKRTKPISDVLPLLYGSMPIDKGYLILNEKDVDILLKENIENKKFIREYLGGDEIIKNKKRWCLWLKNFSPKELQKSSFIRNRIELTKAFRLSSDRPQTIKAAEIPYLFGEIRQPDTDMLVIPKVSSEMRKYIPITYITPEKIINGSALIIPNAPLYYFGVLISNVHMSWMRAVAGRLEMRYQYSANVVYNNFPWPTPTDKQKVKIEQTAHAILDARALYPDSSLADLYDETFMPLELRKAHDANDKAVMAAYGFWKDLTETEIVAELFKMNEELTKK